MKRAATVSGSQGEYERWTSVALPIRYAERRNGRGEAACYCTSSSLLVVRSYLDVGRQKNPKSESHGLFFVPRERFRQIGNTNWGDEVIWQLCVVSNH